MKKQTIGILIGLLLIPGTCFALQADTTKYESKVRKLKKYHKLSFDNPDTLKYRKLFFETFPDSFHELDAIYGYHDHKKEPLYDQAPDHIIYLFNRLGCIKDTVYYEKLINIGIGGHWDADAISHFQYGLQQHSFAKPKLLFGLLSKYPDKKIQSFFYFLYDSGHHPQYKVIPSAFKRIKSQYPNVYAQMEKAFKRVLSDFEE